ncbi:MAG: SelB C-terminal domain-containing protein [Chitinivibrionales bacterium]|nr:SelB C-terminal domain-containing protein [Chitinivibrionales bacterium]
MADRPLQSTLRIDTSISLFETAAPLGLWSQALFLLGTYEATVRIHLIDAKKIGPGETAIAQIQLPVACVARFGDRFVLRGSSGETTIGGGEVIDAAPLHHRRPGAVLVSQLKTLAAGKLPALLAAEINKLPQGKTLARIATTLNFTQSALAAILDNHELPATIVTGPAPERYCIAQAWLKKTESTLVKRLQEYHQSNPLMPTGRTADELAGMAGFAPGNESRLGLAFILERMEQARLIKRVEHTWALTGHAVSLDVKQQERLDFIAAFLRDCKKNAPLMADLLARCRERKIPEAEARALLLLLVAAGRAYKCEDVFLHAEIVNESRMALLKALIDKKDGLTVAAFRDLIGANRKLCLLLLPLYEAEGLVTRVGDMRVITEKGKRYPTTIPSHKLFS